GSPQRRHQRPLSRPARPRRTFQIALLMFVPPFATRRSVSRSTLAKGATLRSVARNKTETAILEATRELLAERGVQKLTVAADPGLAKAFRDRVVAMRLTEVRRLVDRGVKRGDVAPGIDYTLAHELLFGPVYYRLLLSGDPLDDELAERIVDAFLRAFAPL